MRIAFLLAAACSAYGQSATFEVATIKPYERPEGQTWMRMGCSGGPGSKDPARWTCESMGVVHLFREAYELRPYQVAGFDSPGADRYNIVAKIPAGATREQFHEMQRNLLTERFGLKFHTEQKEMPVYELVVAKNGPKLAETAPDAVSELPAPDSKVALGKDGFPEIPAGRSGGASMNGMTTQQVVRGSIGGLAAMLSLQVGRPVIDATGLTGRYSYTLKYASRLLSAAPPPSGAEGAGPAATDPAGPSIVQAIQEQLGLKLESKKGMIEIYVIDKVEKNPTEN